MRALGKWVLIVGLFGMSAGAGRSAPAEKEKIVPLEGAIQLMLLRQESVQEELKLTKDQVHKIDEFADKQWKHAQEIHQQEPDKSKTAFEKLGKENEKFIAETLKPEQHKRLDQISMQVAGLVWVLDPKLSRALNLTDDQKHKIMDLHKAAHQEVEKVIHGTDKAARVSKMDELRKEHRKQLMSVLTDDQKKKWKEMAGEPFKGKLHFVGDEEGKEKGK